MYRIHKGRYGNRKGNVHRQLYYSVVVGISKRDEFDLVHYGKGKEQEKEEEGDLGKYYATLVKTQEYVFDILSKPVIIKIQKQFCMQVMAIAYFRLPMISGILLDGACKGAGMPRVMSQLNSLVNLKGDKSSPIHRVSIQSSSHDPSNSNFFVSSLSLTKLSPSNAINSGVSTPSTVAPYSVLDLTPNDSNSSTPERFVASELKLGKWNIPYPNSPFPAPKIKKDGKTRRKSPFADFLSKLPQHTQSPLYSCQQSWFEVLLNDLSKHIAAEKQADAAAISVSSWFFQHNPSLFQWSLFQNVSPDANARLVTMAESTARVLHDDEYFNDFIAMLISHVCEVAHGSVRWSLVPGYWTICHALCDRLRIMLQSLVTSPSVSFFPTVQNVNSESAAFPAHSWEAMKRSTSIIISCDPQLLQFFSQILINSVMEIRNCQDKDAINLAFNFLDSWFYGVNPELSSPIPPFDFELFFKFIELLLDFHHFQILLKTLCFLYTHMGRFSIPQRTRLISTLLLDAHFYKFFLHWCPEIRRQYHHLLIYRINRNGINRNDRDLDIQTVSSRSEHPREKPSASNLFSFAVTTINFFLGATAKESRAGSILFLNLSIQPKRKMQKTRKNICKMAIQIMTLVLL